MKGASLCALALAAALLLIPAVADGGAASETTVVNSFQLMNRKGDSRTFSFICNRTGTLRISLSWSAVQKTRPCESLYLAVRGPAPESPSVLGNAALRFGQEVTSPFTMSLPVTTDDLLLGKRWSITVTSTKGIGTARCTLRTVTPFAGDEGQRREFHDLAITRLEFESLGPLQGSSFCKVNVKVRVRNAGNTKMRRAAAVVLRTVPTLPGGPKGKVVARWDLKDLAAGAEKQLSKIVTVPLIVERVTFEAEANPAPRSFKEERHTNNVMKGTWTNPAHVNK